MSKPDENAIKTVLDGIVGMADKEMREQSIAYRDLSAAAKDEPWYIFQVYDMAASDVTIAMYSVIKEKYGITRMSDELYWFIREFPVAIDKLSKKIEKEEGPACCVDKAWSRTLAEFHRLIELNRQEEQ